MDKFSTNNISHQIGALETNDQPESFGDAVLEAACGGARGDTGYGAQTPCRPTNPALCHLTTGCRF